MEILGVSFENKPLNRFNLTGQTALVTGGSKGLGQAMALALASGGADVVVTSRHLQESESVAEEIRALGRRLGQEHMKFIVEYPVVSTPGAGWLEPASMTRFARAAEEARRAVVPATRVDLCQAASVPR